MIFDWFLKFISPERLKHTLARGQLIRQVSRAFPAIILVLFSMVVAHDYF